MKTTHNLGYNPYGRLALVKVSKEEVILQVGTATALLSPEQAKLLKDVL